ncbi:MAG: hypothetical protein JNN27_10530 [Planctomycetes bacterium]|nr:hypothetical protein [Planctomycetota bacterium]
MRDSVAIAGAWTDLDGDGSRDVALVSRSVPILSESETPRTARFEVISSRDGQLLQQLDLGVEVPIDADCLTSIGARDGAPELLAFVAMDGVRILVATQAPKSTVVRDASGVVAWIPDEDGDGAAELVVQRANKSPALLPSRTWTADVDRYRSVRGSAASVGDVDADGVVDIIARRSESEGVVAVVSGKSGKLIVAVDETASGLWSSGQDVVSGAEAQDVDGDGQRDFYVASFDPIEGGTSGSVFCISGRDGKRLQRWESSGEFDGGASHLTLIDDEDGDGVRELFLTLRRAYNPPVTAGATALVLSGKSLAPLDRFDAPFGAYPANRALFMPARLPSAPSGVAFASWGAGLVSSLEYAQRRVGGGFVHVRRRGATSAEAWVVP